MLNKASKAPIDIAILGAGGNTGRELLRLLAQHPSFRVVHVSSDRYANKKLRQVFPALVYRDELVFQSQEAVLEKGLPVFLATPDSASLDLVPKLEKEGHPVVDLSAAFRLAQKKSKLVYGLPELNRESISKAKIVANPGCYPTSVILPLVALGELRKQLLSISICASSGISGAGGRVEGAAFSFQEIHENFHAYKILQHQHEPEIEHHVNAGLSKLDRPKLTFVPHLLPIYRGILSTIVLHWKKKAPSKLLDTFRALARKENFVRFYEEPEAVKLANVQNTNYLDISLRSRASSTVIVTALDNLVKGAAGQAIQNMNLMLQLPENTGLHHCPVP